MKPTRSPENSTESSLHPSKTTIYGISNFKVQGIPCYGYSALHLNLMSVLKVSVCNFLQLSGCLVCLSWRVLVFVGISYFKVFLDVGAAIMKPISNIIIWVTLIPLLNFLQRLYKLASHCILVGELVHVITNVCFWTLFVIRYWHYVHFVRLLWKECMWTVFK